MAADMLKGFLTVEITGEEISRFLNICAHRNIYLWDIKVKETKTTLKLGLADFFKLRDIVRKTGCRIRILTRKGIPFFLKKQTRRKLYLATPVLGLFLLWILSNFLWSVEIEGNLSLTRNMLQDFLKTQGVYYGMPLEEVPIHEIKTNLRQEYNDITWVSARLEGTKLIVSLKENDVLLRENKTVAETAGDLTAHHAGVVESILVRSGTPMVKAGEEVEAGQLLIAGKYEIPDESDGTVKRTQYLKADGDVWLTYTQPISESLELVYEEREYTGQIRKKYYLEFLNKNWGIDIRDIPFVNCDLIEERRQLTLPGGYPLPAFLNEKIYRDYVIVEKKYSLEEAEQILQEKFEKIIRTLEEKGVQIIGKNVRIESNSVSVSLNGTLTLRELCKEVSALEEMNDH